MRIIVLIVALCASVPSLADEGMWTFDNFPSSTVEKTYGTEITPAWLDHVRLSTIRLTNCTASFVSPEGLMLTNHHCVESCLAELSSKNNSLLDRGYSAAKRTDERRCSTQLADVLVSMESVTATVAKSLAGLDDKAANVARKKVLTELEQSCEQASAKAKSGKLKCQAVTLYEGGQYFLYKYKRYDDVRLVFAPEADIAAFGGDPDNFQFPRWSLDFSMLRAYEHGKPASTPNHLQINFTGPHANELVFVAGHPGTTQRLETRAQLAFERDLSLPSSLLRAAELRGRYIQFGRITPADEQLVEAPLNNLENGLKVRRKLLDALHDDALMARKSEDERPCGHARKFPAPIRGAKSRRPRRASARCTCRTPSSKAAPASTAYYSAMRACWCAALPRERNPIPSGCENIPTRLCRVSSSSSTREYRSTLKLKYSRCRSPCNACENGLDPTIPWCGNCCSMTHRTPSLPVSWPKRSLTTLRSANSSGKAVKPPSTHRTIP
jgi:hypothetical protein